MGIFYFFKTTSLVLEEIGINELEIVLKIKNENCFFNLISAGVLENQDMLGGVNLTPPLNPMFDV